MNNSYSVVGHVGSWDVTWSKTVWYPYGCEYSRNVTFGEISGNITKTAGSYNVYNFHSNAMIFLGAVLKRVIFS